MNKFEATTEVTEVCPHCETEVTLKWDVSKDGVHAFCPHCGERLMLCSECSYSGYNCDYDIVTDKCKFQKTNANISKSEFVNMVSKVLQIAKPHLRCEYALGKDIPLTEMDRYRIGQSGIRPYLDNDEYVIVYCKNGYRYEINISGNSLCCIAEEIFKTMSCK